MMRKITEREVDEFHRVLLRLGVDGSSQIGDPPKIGLPAWGVVTIEDGTGLGENQFRKIAGLVESFGDQTLVISNTFSLTPNSHMTEVAVKYADFKDAIAATYDYQIYDISLVGQSCKWVAVMQCLAIGYLAAPKEALIKFFPEIIKLSPRV